MIGMFLSGCGAKSDASVDANASGVQPAANANAALSSVEELGLVINFPYEPEDAVWKEDKAAGRLIAVLRFDPADTGKLAAQAENSGAPQPVVVAPETWFPAELTAESDIRGVDEIPGKAYAADQFFQGVYTSGRLVRVDGNDYFILELNAK